MLERPRLDSLASAATVYVTADSGNDSPTLLGSGFFVAPGMVLTTAHVLRPVLTNGLHRPFAVIGQQVNDGKPMAARLHRWLLTDLDREPASGGIPAHEDLALVELLDPVEHECVWLADSAWSSHRLVAFAYHQAMYEGGPMRWRATVELTVRDGEYGMRFGNIEIPSGSSGGPVVDARTGAVVGLLKARRRERDGGLAVSVTALRLFDETYAAVVTAHDRWHGMRGLSDGPHNWVNQQQAIAADDGATDSSRWSPQDRRTALRLLADLPQPLHTPTVAGLARRAGSGGWEPPSTTPQLPCWRDGHGLLYEGTTPLGARTFLRYLRLIAEHEQNRGADAGALIAWIGDRLGTLSFQEAAAENELLTTLRDRVSVTSASTLLPTPASASASTSAPVDDVRPPVDCWSTGGAVLVGVGAYDCLPDVAAIHHNLEDLQHLLVSPEFGIPDGNCRVLKDPRDPKQVHAAIEDVMDRVDPARGAFLFYYAGHGRTHPSSGRLLLSMADSDERRPYSYWSFEHLRDQIGDCGLPTRLVVLDSCYSGSALDLLSGPSDSSAAIRGTYVMTSSGATEPSMAPSGARHTVFTGQILAALRDGIPGAGPVLHADALFERVRRACLADGLPLPARQIRNDGAVIPLVPNRSHRPPRA